MVHAKGELVAAKVQKIKSKVLKSGQESNLRCPGPEFWDDLALSTCCVILPCGLKYLFQYMLLQLRALSRFVDQVSECCFGYQTLILSEKYRLSHLL